MNDIDSMVSGNNTQKSFDKDAWIKQKQEQRQFAYNMEMYMVLTLFIQEITFVK